MTSSFRVKLNRNYDKANHLLQSVYHSAVQHIDCAHLLLLT